MADARMRPEEGRSTDGISELFGAVVEPDSTPLPAAAPAVSPAAPRQFATRREMREALAAGRTSSSAPVQAPDASVDPIAAIIAPSVAVAAAPVVAAPAPVVAAQAALAPADPIAAIIAPQAAVARPVTSPITIPVPAAPVTAAPYVAAAAASEPAAVWSQLAASASSRSADSPAAGPSRRELRGARSAEGVASVIADPISARAVPMAPYTKPVSRVQHHVPKKRASALVTMVAVCGLFATAALPAYALSTVDSDSTTTASAKSDVTALTVNDSAAITATKRGSFSATSTTDIAEQMSNAQEAANYEAYMQSGARELGDDYPYFSELSNNQGGGLSPLNYYYRECVDFVAWRLNRDAGSVEAPFKWDWSYLTPGGGNAYQWKSNWEAHGWTVSNVPVAGSVAWFGYHVGYVKSVNKDGTVTIEEYNHNSDHIYGQRTIPATDVTSYLYAPPE